MRADESLHQYLKSHDSRAAHILLGAPDGRLLDVGSGDGADLRTLAAGGWDAVGVEPFQDSGNGVWVRGVAEKLPFKAQTFSAASCVLVLPNLSNPSLAVKETFRILRPGGRAVFVVFSDSPLNSRIRIMGQTYGGGPWLPNSHIYSPRGIRFLLLRAGFDSVVVYHSDYLPWLSSAIPRRMSARLLTTLENAEPKLSASPLSFLARKVIALAVKT